MDLDLVFLGTSGSMPTAQRAPTALLVRRGGERLLFDCAEGTQRQLLRSNVGLIELREVFLTHYHADHYLGLPGMLKTFALRGREVPITIYGPPGLNELFGALRRIFGRLTYPYELVEIQPGEVLHRGTTRSRPSPSTMGSRRSATHSWRSRAQGASTSRKRTRWEFPRGPSAAPYSGVRRSRFLTAESIPPESVLGGARPGRKVVISADTAYSQAVVEAARGAELLVHEATFAEDEKERARRDPPLDGGRGGGSRTRGEGRPARADPSLEPLFRRRDRAGGAGDLPGHGRPPGSGYHRRPVPGTRFARARERWSHPQARPVAVQGEAVAATIEEGTR